MALVRRRPVDPHSNKPPRCVLHTPLAPAHWHPTMADHRTPAAHVVPDDDGFGEVHVQAKVAPYHVRVNILDVFRKTESMEVLMAHTFEFCKVEGKQVTLVVDMRNATGNTQDQSDVLLGLVGSIGPMVDVVRAAVSHIVVVAHSEVVGTLKTLIDLVNMKFPPKEGGIPRSMFKFDDPASAKDMATTLAELHVQ